jgi:hypothetical protein
MQSSSLVSKFVRRSAVTKSSLLQQQSQQTMKFSSTVAVSMLFGAASAFAPNAAIHSARAVKPATFSSVAVEMGEKPVFDQEQFIQESKDMRMKHLEEQAMFALKIAAENYGNAGTYILMGRASINILFTPTRNGI